ncbi:hypothetical protein M9980_09210 [Sphingomonas donggukensis]|uniref:Uncharacterized protein n=1 Tax=Sphingomonas donggukensis TaxID=2949093 RepID=A0ABY4TR91_9SPHN|nr:hypothetical protein [Sphingomonas donggukensis]URW74752.1 hypothetical protein M9980_09210 [Sphingomonas donggukensis]
MRNPTPIVFSPTHEAKLQHNAEEDQQVALNAADPFARAAALDTGILLPSRRHDGWTAARQQKFLFHLAEGLTVHDACTIVGLSPASAYAFRNSARGAAFNVGWNAALLLQRNRIVDDLTSRALRGQTNTITHPDGSTTEHHRYDNGVALRLLARLDRIAAAEGPDHTGDARAARLAAQEWDRYLDLIGEDAGNARAGMFLALRVTEGESAALAPIAALGRADCYVRAHAGVPGEVDTSDLDPAKRADWSADQWCRAEAAGLLALAPESSPHDPPIGHQLCQHSREEEEEDSPFSGSVWFCEDSDEWRTDFPPPPDFDGIEDGEFGDPDYARDLSDDERALVEAAKDRETTALAAVEGAQRDAWFAALAAELETAAERDAAPHVTPASNTRTGVTTWQTPATTSAP